MRLRWDCAIIFGYDEWESIVRSFSFEQSHRDASMSHVPQPVCVWLDVAFRPESFFYDIPRPGANNGADNVSCVKGYLSSSWAWLRCPMLSPDLSQALSAVPLLFSVSSHRPPQSQYLADVRNSYCSAAIMICILHPRPHLVKLPNARKP